ncbi:MAG: hypothetical protein WD534_15720 [Phycisphaeraceae bacterium]
MVRNMMNAYRMDRSAFTVTTFQDAERQQRAMWHAMSPQQRLEMLEYLRQVNYGYDACARRLQRVLEASQRERR